MPNKNIPTGYANSKRRVIFTSAAGKPYVRTEDGKKSYQPKAKFALNNNGSTRVIQKANLNKIPTAIRPKRAPAKAPAKKAPNAFKTVKKAASPSKRTPAKTVRKTVRKVPARKAPNAPKNANKASPSMANTRAYLMNRGYTKKAAAKVAPLVKQGMPSARYSKTTGMVKGRGPRGAYRKPGQKSRSLTKAKAKPNSLVKKRTRTSNSLKAGQDFAKMMNRLTAKPRKMIVKTVKTVAMGNNKVRKVRKNKGVGRALVASPGGTLYKGRAALTRKQRAAIKKNAIAIANSIRKMLK